MLALPILAHSQVVVVPVAGETMTAQAKGSFDVQMKPESAPDDPVGRFSIAKQFHGDIDGTSVGEMLAVGNPSGSAGYVAMERVTGTVRGKGGSFALQHTGTMDNGHPSLSIKTVPGSGTGDLTGIVGELTLEITGGKHNYVFSYTLPK
jgi:hypothetical protein